MMNKNRLQSAVFECKRFLEKVREYEKSDPGFTSYGSKQSGSVKRASMDLTRALAEIRKSGYS